MSIGARIKEERARLGLSQEAFSLAGGVQRRAQVRYEKDERQPDADYLAAIAQAGADVGYITTGVRQGEEHVTPAAQLLRMKVLASLIADELHQCKASLSEVSFHELLDELWPEWSADGAPEPMALRGRIGHALLARGIKR